MTTLLLCLSLLIAAVQFSTVDSAQLPCDSPLREYLPHDPWFAHCSSCSYGQWSPWRSSIPVQVRDDRTCDSGEARKYERSKTAVPGSTCTPDTVNENKYECKQLQKCDYGLEALIPLNCLLASFIHRWTNTEAESSTNHSITSSWSRCR